MSNIVFFGIPAHGHTNPTLEVVKELTGRGHQVWYYSYEMFREKIESMFHIAASSCIQWQDEG